MTDYTPGPWHAGHFVDDTSSCNCTSIYDEGRYMGAIADICVDNGKSIGDGGNDSPPLEEAKANARLIAAAPDLLAQLQSAERWLSEIHSDADGDEKTELREVHSAAWEAIDKMRAAIAKARGQTDER